MAVFATLFGKLAQRISADKDAQVQLRDNVDISGILGSHIGMVPNPLSERSKHLELRIQDAQVFRSVCPYCAVGCGQLVYVKDGKVLSSSPLDSPLLWLRSHLSFR
ncbi:hypothetical protein KSZ_08120 [Dictyobacter formicarum]|uniref:4Fe-4S Mo/W bis-MGD-type domain-containing protein n=1 Tax=Dictyobacter formicarum TaxID=2778368 RepID=A0ABQ3VAT7_9CHLR|nr:hypothetical protein KSZ_08120 [Dictyobacter formicarum]